MPDVLMSPDKVPAKFSMVEAEPPLEPTEPPVRRIVRCLRQTMDRLRSAPARPLPRDHATSAAAW